MAAKGRSYTGWLVAGLLVMTFLVSTGAWNPFPGLWNWVNQDRPVSEPAPVWQQRLGGTPKSVTVAGSALVVEQRTSVEGRRVADGTAIWSRRADWSAVAGSGADSAVAYGRLLVKGYDVVDPATGGTLRHDGQATAVWTYRDALLDVRCHRPKDCTLTSWAPRGTSPNWSVDVPGIGSVLFADNPGLQSVRRLTASKVEDQAGGPDALPRLLGFPVDGSVYLVDTAEGRVLPEVKPDRREQIVVVGGRVLRVTARSGDGGCYFAVSGRDALTSGPVWQQAGINLRTASGSGCEQRKTPAGAENVVLGVAPDGRELLLDAYDGRVLWIADPGEKVLAMDNLHALVRSADGKSIKGMPLGGSGTLWTRPVRAGAQAALTADAAIIIDKRPDRIIALNPETGAERLNIRSEARVLGCGPAGVVIGDGRAAGYLTYTAGGADGSTVSGGDTVSGDDTTSGGNSDGGGDTGGSDTGGGTRGKGEPGKDG